MRCLYRRFRAEVESIREAKRSDRFGRREMLNPNLDVTPGFKEPGNPLAGVVEARFEVCGDSRSARRFELHEQLIEHGLPPPDCLTKVGAVHFCVGKTM